MLKKGDDINKILLLIFSSRHLTTCI